MIIFHPQAQQELLEAAAFYEEQLNDLGTEFLSVIEQTTDKIEENPKSYYCESSRSDFHACKCSSYMAII